MSYLKIKELWEIHVKKMKRRGEKPVSLPTFYRRCNVVTGLRWSVNKAIHTPSYKRRNFKRRKWYEKLLYKLMKIWKRVWK